MLTELHWTVMLSNSNMV